MSNNTLEELFSEYEAKFSNLFEKIKVNNKPELTFKDYDLLIYFIVFQLVKTPQKFENIITDDSEFSSRVMKGYEFTNDEYHTFTLYSILCLSEKIYLSCLSRLDKINIYYNTSSVNFITSDDPSFNQKFDEKKLHIQIPISPKIMIELTENCSENKAELSKYYSFNKDYLDVIQANVVLINFYEIDGEGVQTLNNKILNAKHRFIYASCENDIKDLIEYSK